jgi:hypothetical protein
MGTVKSTKNAREAAEGENCRIGLKQTMEKRQNNLF